MMPLVCIATIVLPFMVQAENIHLMRSQVNQLEIDAGGKSKKLADGANKATTSALYCPAIEEGVIWDGTVILETGGHNALYCQKKCSEVDTAEIFTFMYPNSSCQCKTKG